MLSSQRPLTELYDVALLDLDGVVYLGERVIDHVPDALASAREQGMRLAFVTNNASRTPAQVAELLTRLGVPAASTDVITSSHAAAHYLADRFPSGAAVLVLGTTGLIDALTERGLRPVFSADDNPVAVVQGYSPTMDWAALAEGMVAIRNGALWVATNLDPTVPSPRGPLPGNGSLVAALRHASGQEPVATGKPDPTMHAESVQRSKARQPLVVGDRLDTDIEGARRADCASLLVLTGVTRPLDLLAAEPVHRPDYVAADVRGLLESHPDVHAVGGGFRCGAVTAVETGSMLRVSIAEKAQGTKADSDLTDERVNLLRALAQAAWAIADAGRRRAPIEAADDRAAQLLKAWDLVE
ncbi:HAD-IIA family hydrolase [Jatrophihabitans telluris]|uniref:HAD-IIA family hydrolase n=1 Tax=Jatrophihabitans telluris TaxID=2038343 RepID=A0ABY4R3Y8_9ACTN|nr:HAD-IIA family hydrolase [Jatrophihabitans telluris]UQX90112.1 HAD-IIA family hydrolase [Jatrophihabitans telluris]